MNPQEFAQKVKSKFPEYRDLPDAELTDSVLKAHPQYRKHVNMEELTQDNRATFDKAIDNPVTRGIQKFFPGKKIGESIGTLAGFGITAAKEKFGAVPEGTTDAFDVTPPTATELGGDIVGGAANIAGFKGAGTAGPFVQRLMKSTGIGAGIFGGSTAAEGGSLPEIGRSAATGGAFGGAMPVAGKVFRSIGDQIDNLPSRFVESALGRSKAQILRDSRKGGQSMARYVIDNKRVGTAETMLRESDRAVDSLGKQIQTMLVTATTKTGRNPTIGRDIFLDEIAQLPEARGALMNRAEVRSVIEKIAPQSKELLQKNSWSLSDANKLRQLLDSTLGDRGFLSQQLSTNKAVLKAFANNLRNTVKDRAPGEVRSMFGELSKEIQLRDALAGRIAQKASNQVLSFGDFIGGGLGGIFGSFVSNPLLGAGAGVATRRAIESVPFKVGSAKFIDTLTKVGPILEELTPAQQTAILDLISSLSTPESNQGEKPQR